MLIVVHFVSLYKLLTMSTQEIKSLLHEGIENINDNEFLLAIKQILDRKYTTGETPHLSDWQISRIEASKAQIADGNFISNTQADSLIEKWLKE